MAIRIIIVSILYFCTSGCINGIICIGESSCGFTAQESQHITQRIFICFILSI